MQTFDRNQKFVDRLAEQYSANVWHLSFSQTIELAAKLNVEKWIKTTSKKHFGYGGARNSVFLLAPVIQRAALEGVNTFAELMEKPLGKLKTLFEESTLGQEGHDTVISLGEDDIYIAPCNFFDDALFTFHHQDIYFQRHFFMKGRSTFQVNAGVYMDNIWMNPSRLFDSTLWEDKPAYAGMLGLLGKPIFCLPLPFGSEENHVVLSSRFPPSFRQPVVHLPGTRFPNHIFPISPLDGIEKYLRQYISYSFGVAMMQNLLDPGNFAGHNALAWNDKPSPIQNVQSLGELLDFIFKEETQSQLQSRFWNNLEIIFENEREFGMVSLLNNLAVFNPQKGMPVPLKNLYGSLQKEALCCLAFRKACLKFHTHGALNPYDIAKKEVEKEFNVRLSQMPLAHSLYILIQTICTFMRRKI